jgi:phosphoribosylformylglycinamidine synthase II
MKPPPATDRIEKTFRIELTRRDDVRPASVTETFKAFGVTGVEQMIIKDVYYISGALSPAQAERIASELLCDGVVETYRLAEPEGFEILYNPGVTDPREESVRKAIRDLGIDVKRVRTGTNYIITGTFDEERLKQSAALFLYNPLVQHIRRAHEKPRERTAYSLENQEIGLEGDLMTISRDMGLSLSMLEMEKIKEYFDAEGRKPTIVELETIAQTWSEHCRHKTFLGNIQFDGERIENLLKDTIMKATQHIDHPMCLSVFHDNSGVIDFDDEYGVCFKVETHNHPSALEPYGGAATGIGGVIRDILGTGLGAYPIMNTDVFCFGLPEYDYRKLPAGILHPKTIIKGVIRGVRDYGNRMGIPTASGALYFDEDFFYNPLVFCGCVGLIRKDRIEKGARCGDAVVLVGGRTGRDGIHGVTFASAELSESAEKSCVQIGNPIMEKRVMDCLTRVSDMGILSSVTDCGGGGLSSAVGEMGKECGVRVDLAAVPLKYEGLSPREIWISESQERMILAVPQIHVSRVLEEFGHEAVEATIIGEFTDDGRLRLLYGRDIVCDLDMHFLHDGLPMPTKTARMRKRKPRAVDLPKPVDLTSLYLEVVGSLNSCSREWVIREYDHEVQGASVIKPLVGVQGIGPQDAVVIKPRFDSKKGVIVACGINPAYGKRDAYRMSLSVIDEALRNIVATGGTLERIALLDNFCFSSPEREEVLADIVMSARACYDAALAFRTPFISGKDSLYNEWSDAEGIIRLIPPTLLVSAIGIVDDVDRCVTLDLKKEGSELYLIGLTREELGGSEYYRLLDISAGEVPDVDLASAPEVMKRTATAISQGLVLSCHDTSEGGLAVALAEMAIAGMTGIDVDLDAVVFEGDRRRFDTLLFSESNTRFIVEVQPGHGGSFSELFKGIPCARIGMTRQEQKITVRSGTRVIVDLPLDVVKHKWQRKII